MSFLAPKCSEIFLVMLFYSNRTFYSKANQERDVNFVYSFNLAFRFIA